MKGCLPAVMKGKDRSDSTAPTPPALASPKVTVWREVDFQATSTNRSVAFLPAHHLDFERGGIAPGRVIAASDILLRTHPVC